MAGGLKVSRRRSVAYGAQVAVLAGVLAITSGATTRSKSSSSKPATTKGGSTVSSSAALLPVFQGGLKNGWQDFGWSDVRQLTSSGARVDFGNYQGWLLDRNALPIEASTIVVKYRTSGTFGTFLRIGLTPVGASDVTAEANLPNPAPGKDGLRTVVIPVEKLVPSRQFFQIRFRPIQQLPAGSIVDFLSISVSNDAGSASAATQPTAATRPGEALKPGATVNVDCQSPDRKPIDSRIYGISNTGASYLTADTSQLGATINRWGGNTTSRYNFKLGNVWNTALDYYWRNVEVADGTNNAVEKFFGKNKAEGRLSAVTVPMLGWVAKDSSSYTFPVSKYGKQQSNDPDNADIGNGVASSGQKLRPPDPSATSVAIGPDDVGQWVASSLRGRTNMYFLDNEIELWYETHRDVHPEPTTYDEVLDKSIRYATAIKKNDPQAFVAGPASWGWPAYSYSAADAAAGFNNAPDRKAHGDVPLLAWYLRKMKEQQDKTGQRLLDVLDVHYYPQQTNVYGGGVGGTDPITAQLRIRSTRALWDPAYSDESWIGTAVQLLPRMKKLIDENYPGTGLSIGEWSFGGEGHMSGGLATAEALGRFGANGVTAAFYWTAPPAGSPTFWAFRAFRNVDGKGTRFQDVSIGATSTSSSVSAFASTDAANSQVVMVLLNTDPSKSINVGLAPKGCKAFTSTQTFTYDGQGNGFQAQSPQPTGGTQAVIALPKYSITVVKAVL